MNPELSVFIAKVSKGYVGYVRIYRGRVLRYTDSYPTVEEAEREAISLKNILLEHQEWWD